MRTIVKIIARIIGWSIVCLAFTALGFMMVIGTAMCGA